MKRIKLALAVAAAMACVAPSNAATYMLNYTANSGSPLPTTGSFTIVTSDILNGAGGYDILSATGSFTANGNSFAVALAGLNPPGFNTDNVYYAADPYFTNPGIGFQYAGGWANLWGNGAGRPYSFWAYDGQSYFVSTDGALVSTPGALNPNGTGVPEPEMWMLMIVGFGFVGVSARRSRKTVAA